jgi:hypothetical protein
MKIGVVGADLFHANRLDTTKPLVDCRSSAKSFKNEFPSVVRSLFAAPLSPNWFLHSSRICRENAGRC